MDVMQKIKESASLQEYFKITEKLAMEVSDEMIEMIDEEKHTLDEKVEEGKYAYMILKHQYYTNLHKSFSSFNKGANEAIVRTK